MSEHIVKTENQAIILLILIVIASVACSLSLLHIATAPETPITQAAVLDKLLKK